MRDDEYYEKIFDRLETLLPDFTPEEPDHYPILFDFALYMMQNFSDSEILYYSTEFINQCIDDGGPEMEEDMIEQVFNGMYDVPELVERFRPFLTRKSREVFERGMILWNSTPGGTEIRPPA